MTGCTCRSSIVVLTDYPFRGIEVHLVLIGVVVDTMLGFLVDLYLRVIRTHMALAAVFRLTRLSH